MDAGQAAEVLHNVFEECGIKPNSVPMEALTAYSVYRSERFHLQRGVLAAVLILFFLLPFLFVRAGFTVDMLYHPVGVRIWVKTFSRAKYKSYTVSIP